MTILDLITSRDFALNILAGLTIFILDVLLITLWLPRILHRRQQAQWAPARADLAKLVLGVAETYFWIGFQAIHNIGANQDHPDKPPPTDEERKELRKLDYRLLNQNYQEAYNKLLPMLPIYAPTFDADIARTVSELLHHFDDLQRQLGSWPTDDLVFLRLSNQRLEHTAKSADAIAPLIEHLYRRVGLQSSNMQKIKLTEVAGKPMMLSEFAPFVKSVAQHLFNDCLATIKLIDNVVPINKK